MRNNKFLFYTLLCTVILLSSCNGRRGKGGDMLSEMQPITLGTLSTMDDFPFYVAQKTGIYDSLGIKLTIKNYSSSISLNEAFVADSIDGLISDLSSAMLLRERHPLSIIMQNDGYYCFIVSKKSNIRKLSQLKYHNIGVTQGTIISVATDELLKRIGLRENEINLPEINQAELRLHMLQDGEIDGTFLPDPIATKALNMGFRSLISTNELDVDQTSTSFSKKAINEKKDEIEKLLIGYDQAVRYINSHTPSELAPLVAGMTGLSESQARLIVLPNYMYAQKPDADEIARAINEVRAKALVPANYNLNNFVDTTFLPPQQEQEQVPANTFIQRKKQQIKHRINKLKNFSKVIKNNRL